MTDDDTPRRTRAELERDAERLRMVLAEAGYPRAEIHVSEQWNDVYTTTAGVVPPDAQVVPLDVLQKAWAVVEAGAHR